MGTEYLRKMITLYCNQRIYTVLMHLVGVGDDVMYV